MTNKLNNISKNAEQHPDVCKIQPPPPPPDDPPPPPPPWPPPAIMLHFAFLIETWGDPYHWEGTLRLEETHPYEYHGYEEDGDKFIDAEVHLFDDPRHAEGAVNLEREYEWDAYARYNTPIPDPWAEPIEQDLIESDGLIAEGTLLEPLHE